jgi:invasion protein IalB
MANGNSQSGGMRLVGFGAGLLALAALAMTPAIAQQKKDAAPPAAKKDAAPKGDSQQSQSAWVKLCEKTPVADAAPGAKADAKAAAPQERTICLTHHERLDGNTGMVLVSAAIRVVDNSDKTALMVMVPLGMAIPPGLKAAVYSKEQWAKAQKNEKIDDKSLKPIDLKFTLCHQGGCTAEAESPSWLIDQMKTGGGLMILALNLAGQPIAFPVPLDGFEQAHKGPPVDNEAYGKARGQLMAQIRERQIQLFKEYQEQMKKQQEGAPGAGGAAPADKAAPKAADPKKK